jgi:hypothetical protein
MMEQVSHCQYKGSTQPEYKQYKCGGQVDALVYLPVHELYRTLCCSPRLPSQQHAMFVCGSDCCCFGRSAPSIMVTRLLTAQGCH